MTDRALIYYDEAMLAHKPEGWDPDHPEWTAAVQALLREQLPEGVTWSHPERPQRLSAIVDSLHAEPVSGTRWCAVVPASRAALERVHTPRHVDTIEASRGRSAWLDMDTTAVSPGSADAARLAAGAAATAVEAVVRGPEKRAFALVRPPGHHALAERAMGFCLYNSVAVAAAHARATLGCQRVLIVDWDMHHGNGTQAIFYREPDVMLFDTHGEAPFYPGSGLLEEIGEQEGVGATVNVPLALGSGDQALMAAFDALLRPVAARFRPDIVLVSAGFDAHHQDKVMSMTAAGFANLCAVVGDIADEYAGGRLVLALEGGYNAEALSSSVRACLSVLAGEPPPRIDGGDDDPGMASVRRAIAFHRRVSLA